MPDRDQFSQLVTSTIELLDVLEVSELQDEPLWVFVVNEDTVIELHLDAESDRVVLGCDLAKPEDNGKAQMYEMLLAYNSLWQQTGGGRMSLNAHTGVVEFCMEVPASPLQPDSLFQVMSDFMSVALSWREVIQNGDLSAAGRPSLLDDMQAAIRV
ncbi:MAG: type III secretion system chaperone [Prosthecobacter sp.]